MNFAARQGRLLRMASTLKTIEELPQEMQAHTYPIMYQVEGTHWWFVGRRKIISSFVEQIIRDSGNEHPRILDVGCGTGANLEMLSKYGEAEGVDVSPDALTFCRNRGLKQVKLGQAEKLPYEDASFELATGLDVIEHLDDDLEGLSEMYRVLRPGGYALIFVPAFMFLWGVQDDISNHRRRYTLPQISESLRRAGFELQRASYVNLTFFLPILIGRWLMRLTGLRPESENNLTLGFLNGFLAAILGAEASLLKHINFPFGVSVISVARRPQ